MRLDTSALSLCEYILCCVQPRFIHSNIHLLPRYGKKSIQKNSSNPVSYRVDINLMFSKYHCHLIYEYKSFWCTQIATRKAFALLQVPPISRLDAELILSWHIWNRYYRNPHRRKALDNATSIGDNFRLHKFQFSPQKCQLNLKPPLIKWVVLCSWRWDDWNIYLNLSQVNYIIRKVYIPIKLWY